MLDFIIAVASDFRSKEYSDEIDHQIRVQWDDNAISTSNNRYA